MPVAEAMIRRGENTVKLAMIEIKVSDLQLYARNLNGALSDQESAVKDTFQHLTRQIKGRV